MAKSYDLADEWLPSWKRRNPAGHAAHACKYATRYREVADIYGHQLSRSEVDALDAACH